MRRSRIAIAVIAIVSAVFAVIVYERVASKGATSPVDGPAPQHTGTMERAGAASVADGPFDAQREQLEVAAANGDAHAAFRMGNVIAHCMEYRPLASGRVAQMLATLVAGAGSSIQIGGRPLNDDRSLDLLVFAQEEAARVCADTDSLRARPPALDAYAYIAQAADAGHPAAMALYPDLAFRDFRTPSALIENANEVERRRTRARAYLRRAVASGSPESLLAASKAYSADGWLADDPEQALAYWLAYASTSDAKRIPESLTSDRTAELESLATSLQRERAAAFATRIISTREASADAY